MTLEIVGEIDQAETIASGSGVKIRPLLRKVHGRGRWRKRKVVATVRLASGKLRRVELQTTQFALCLDNAGNEASLIRGKVYRALRDPRAAKDDLIRVVDESGEDYLFERTQFAVVDFPQTIRRKLLALQRAG